jgi:hypothetical protein
LKNVMVFPSRFPFRELFVESAKGHNKVLARVLHGWWLVFNLHLSLTLLT